MIAARLRKLWPFGKTRREERIRCRVLFVCMGNVCRSPTAEAVFRRKIELAGLADLVDCTSAGTHDFNLGAAPDGRARAVALKRGYDMSRLRGRQVSAEDFARYDLILAMDRQNFDALAERCPPARLERLKLLMAFARRHEASEIPDPYYSTAKGFELVLDMIEDACEGLLEHVRSHGIAPPASGEQARREA